VERGEVDFSSLKTGRRLPAVHPGEVLREDFLKPLGLSQYALAKATRLDPMRVNEIVRGRRAVSADTALRLARYFGGSALWWLRLQAAHDHEVAARRHGRRIAREIAPRAA
jgi:addiction module HigA family antidote